MRAPTTILESEAGERTTRRRDAVHLDPLRLGLGRVRRVHHLADEKLARRGLVLDVRMTLKTGDGVLIYVHWHGIMRFELAEQAYALDFAKPDDVLGAQRYYFRASPRFEVADERYAWLNGL